MSSSTNSSSASNGQLLVDFPTRRRRRPAVRFDPKPTVYPIRSTLTMISDKRELWYSRHEEEEMKIERNTDAIALARTLLSPSAEELKEYPAEDLNVHVSQAIGLEKVINPVQAKKRARTLLLHRMTVLRLQEVKDDEELCQISQKSSSSCSARAHMFAKAWFALDR